MGEELERGLLLLGIEHSAGALADDRQPRVEVGRLEVDDEARLEPVSQAGVECGHRGRRAIGCDHDLRAGCDQRVEGVKELLCGSRLSLDELDVVEEQQVGAAVTVLEGSIALARSAAVKSLVKVSPVA